MMVIKDLIDLSGIHFLMYMQQLLFLLRFKTAQLLSHHSDSIVCIDLLMIIPLLFGNMNHL